MAMTVASHQFVARDAFLVRSQVWPAAPRSLRPAAPGKRVPDHQDDPNQRQSEDMPAIETDQGRSVPVVSRL